MVGFLKMTPTELAEVLAAAESLTAIELCSVLLALGGDMFGPDSIYATGLTTAVEKMERMLDDVRVRTSRARRGLSPDTPAEQAIGNHLGAMPRGWPFFSEDRMPMPRLNLQQIVHSQFDYRITEDLRARLTNAACANKHSLTQEITDRLESSFVDHDQGALIAENNAMLKALYAHHRIDVQ